MKYFEHTRQIMKRGEVLDVPCHVEILGIDATGVEVKVTDQIEPYDVNTFKGGERWFAEEMWQKITQLIDLDGEKD